MATANRPSFDIGNSQPIDIGQSAPVSFDIGGSKPIDIGASTPLEASSPGSPIMGGRYSGFPADRADNRPPEDSWATLGRKLIQDAPTMFKQVGGGIARMLAESAPEPPSFMMPGDPQWEPIAKTHRDLVEAATTAGTMPGQKLYEQATADLMANAPNVDPESIKGYANDIARAVVQMVPAVSASLLTKRPSVGASIIGGQVMGQRYGESREAGRTPDQSTADAVFYAATEGLPEMIPLGILMKRGGKFLPRVFKTAAAESIQETVTEALQMGYDAGILDEEMTWEQALTNLRRAAIIGAGAGGTIAAGTHPFTRGSEDQSAASGLDFGELGSALRGEDAPTGSGPGRPQLPPPPGEREKARAQTSPPSPEDVASPIPTDLIQQGREVLQDAAGERSAEIILDEAGFPPINSRVMVGPEGQQVPAMVVDAFDENGRRGAKLQYASGRTVSETFEALQGRVTPTTLEGETDAEQAPAQEATQPEAPAQQEAPPERAPEPAEGVLSQPLDVAGLAPVRPEIASPALPESQTPTTTQQPEAASTSRFDPETTAAMRDLNLESGWEEVGGRMIRKTEDRDSPDYAVVTGRTPWLPRADWWPGRPGGYNEAQTERIIERGLAGERLGPKQQEYFDYLLEVVQERQRQEPYIPDELIMRSEDLLSEDASDTQQDAETVALTAQAVEIDEDAVEQLAKQYENDDAGFREAVRQIVAQNAATLERGKEGAGPQEQGLDTEGLTLVAPAAPPAALAPTSPSRQPDLLGDDTRTQQALANEKRRRDTERSTGQDSVETGDPTDLFSQARQQVDISDKPANLPATTKKMFVQFGRRRAEVQSLEEAQRKWELFRNATNAGASELPRASVVDENGNKIADIAYNGRIIRPGEDADATTEEARPAVAFDVGDRVRHNDGNLGTVTNTRDGEIQVRFDGSDNPPRYMKSEVFTKQADAAPIEAPAETGPTAPIEDFGETLEGARKHIWEKYRDRLQSAGELDTARQPLSKTWPEPDYQKLIEDGADPWVVGFIRAARDEIPVKPKKPWKLKQWVKQVEALRNFSEQALEGRVPAERIRQGLDEHPVFKSFADRIELYVAVGHAKSLKGVRVSVGQYGILNGEKLDPPKTIWTVERAAKATAFSNWPTQLAQGDTRAEAIANFKRDYDSIDTQPKASKQVKFDIYSYRRGPKAGRWFIGKKVGRDRVDLREFDSVKEARAYLKESHAELVKALERWKSIPAHRKEADSPRVGADHRNGADITPEVFEETFGFRGVQFGNYVEGPRRQQDLNQAYDALLDLAGVLGVPAKALSLNGELGLAFGARGKGGKRPARAHYEPDTIVINLTKREGAGSLAHEWWHAMDNYFSRRRGDKPGYVSEDAMAGRPPGSDNIRPEVLDAFVELGRAINRTSLRERSRGLDKRRTKPYWSTGREMSARAFESYIVARLQDQEQANDYLANIVSEDYWKAAAALGVGEGTEQKPDYPYPTAAEIPVVRAGFDNLFDTIETRTTDEGTVELFSRAQETGFYSALTRAAEGLKQERGQPGQMLAMLKKQPGVKAEEVQWSGIEEYLRAQDGAVTKEQIVAFLDANGVQIEEVLLAGDELDPYEMPDFTWHDEGIVDDDIMTLEYSVSVDGVDETYRVLEDTDAGNVSVQVVDTGEWLSLYGPINNQSLGDAERAIEDRLREKFERESLDDSTVTQAEGPAKFAEYTLPGGTNYREVLLTLPIDGPQFDESLVEIRRDIRSTTQGSTAIYYDGQLLASYGDDPEIQSDGAFRQKPDSYWMDVARRVFEQGDQRNRLPARGAGFSDPHFDQPNILAHFRVNDRTGPNGERILHVEEIQSGVHQKGRKAGYGDKIIYEAYVDGDLRGQFDSRDEAELATARDRGHVGIRERTVSTGVPDVPFKNNAWVELAIKRVLRMAAEDGYDAVSWTTGEQQAERYDLSKQVSEIAYWQDDSDGSFGITVLDTNGTSITGMEADYFDAENLADVVGKEIAEKIINDEGNGNPAVSEFYNKSTGKLEEGVKVLQGEDLKVGGEGMKSFYDRTLPNIFKKVGKKLDKSVQIGETGFPNIEAREGRAFGDDPIKVHAIPITPQMRESAMAGLPLFSYGAMQPAFIEKADAIEADLKNNLQQAGIADRVALRLVDQIRGTKSGQAMAGVQGRYASRMIEIATTSADPAWTLDHETVHALRDLGLFRDAEWRTLERTARRDKPRMKELGRRYAKDDLTPEALTEEAIADMYADWAAGKSKPKGFVRRAFERIRDFFRALSNALRGNGFRTAESIFEDVQRGNVGRRGTANEPRAPDSFSRSAAFRRWFGDSKVVDESGQPLVVYHGGQKLNAWGDQYDGIYGAHAEAVKKEFASMLSQGEIEKLDNPVFFFTDSEAVAEGYGDQGDNYEVRPSFLKIENPLDLRDDFSKVSPFLDDKNVDFESMSARDLSRLLRWDWTKYGKRIKAAGYDGIIFHDTDVLDRGMHTAYGVFESTQIKSTSNRGTFDPDNPDVRYSRARVSPDGFDNVNESVVDLVRQKLQDRYIDLRRLQEARAPASDAADAYLAEELYHGKAEAAIEEARDTAMTPLMEAVKASGLTFEQADEYLYARHAKERNARIQEINPRFRADLAQEGGGSGMTDSQADAILARYEGRADVARIGELADNIVRRDRDLLIEAGLERPETVEAWEAMYQHYVPLKGLEGDEAARSSPGRGRGFDVRGRQRRAFGRRSRAQSVIANLLAQYETDIIRAQKAEVGRALLRFAEANPDPNVWEVDRAQYQPSIDPATGLVRYRRDSRFQLADNVLVVKVDGVDHHITFHGENGRRIAYNMKNLGAANAGPVIRAFASVNRMLSMVNTSLNPEFVISNLARDLQTAGINLAGTQADALKGRIILDVGSAWRGIRHAQKGNVDIEWARHFEDFRKAGGKTGWIDAHSDVTRLQGQLEKELRAFDRKSGDPRTLIRKLGQFIENENIAVENAVRLSAFVHARRAGMSAKRAASLAKNLTVNFNRKGEWGVVANSLYLFYNASIQGQVRMLQALKSAKVRKIAAGIIAFAAILDIINRLVGGDDEDGIPKYDKVPSWIKERNLVIMAPGTEDGYYKIPLPWGYNIFHVIGQQSGEAASAAMGLTRDYRPTESAQKVLGAVVGAFNPLGSDASISQFLSPTITDPIVSLGENMDWSGRPIRPQENPFATAPEPDSQKYWNSTGEVPRWVTERINELTGGSTVRPGAIDVSPTTLEYLYEFATGGAGRFVSNMVDAPLKQIVDGEVEHYRIPFVRKVYGEVGTRATQDRYYENLEQVYYAEQEMKVAIEEQDAAMRQKVQTEHRAYLQARTAAKAAEREMKELRDARNAIRAQPMDEKVRRRRLRNIEDRMEKVMLRFNGRVQSLKER